MAKKGENTSFYLPYEMQEFIAEKVLNKEATNLSNYIQKLIKEDMDKGKVPKDEELIKKFNGK